MKICWCAEIEKDTNSCRLFMHMDNAINMIRSDMLKIGYIVYVDKYPEHEGMLMKCVSPKDKDNYLLWVFNYIEVEDS